ncbi:MAG: PhoH family protein [Cellvibrionales bacterium]|nr:PhoH family protein [Cellvibrionales bacterium]MBT5922265.1 PhoH family protein [Cellvibrionales bacterium]MBT6578876.1 PhoH family protein [Cellvibrionales bacterium]
MNSPILSAHLTLEPNDTRRLAKLCGPFDEHLRQIEKRLGVKIKNRGNRFQFDGINNDAQTASTLVNQLYKDTANNVEINSEYIHLHLQESGISQLMKPQDNSRTVSNNDNMNNHAVDNDDSLAIQTRRKLINPRGGNQQEYIDAIRNNDINFGIGPAGTGKTWLAVACAVEALEQNRVDRILLVRPAVEAGEKLGFLPGDLAQKIDPYLRPLYDALYEMMGADHVSKLIERNIIEVAPLAFMRGRTLSNSFIILDESQNTTREQMKMFLTRIGFNSTAVVTGDDTQIDLPHRRDSGLLHVEKVLKSVEGLTFTHFDSSDVVRHPLVKRIVDAYAIDDKAAEIKKSAKHSPKEK